LCRVPENIHTPPAEGIVGMAVYVRPKNVKAEMYEA